MSDGLLIVVAAPAEWRAVVRGLGALDPGGLIPAWRPVAVRPNVEVVLSGIGKANAAGATAAVLAGRSGSGWRAVSVGVAGTLDPSVAIGDVVCATTCVFADEGVLTPEGFTDTHAMGFPLGGFEGSAVPVDAGMGSKLRDVAGRHGPVATVSTCSGTDSLAASVRARTGALAEGMEGAAVALVAHRLRVGAAELRVISNTTGDRAGQRWELSRALGVLSDIIGPAVRALAG